MFRSRLGIERMVDCERDTRSHTQLAQRTFLASFGSAAARLTNYTGTRAPAYVVHTLLPVWARLIEKESGSRAEQVSYRHRRCTPVRVQILVRASRTKHKNDRRWSIHYWMRTHKNLLRIHIAMSTTNYFKRQLTIENGNVCRSCTAYKFSRNEPEKWDKSSRFISSIDR